MTSKVAYLGCRYSMPGSPDRRADAYEQDREVAAMREPLARLGIDLVELDWEIADPADPEISLYLVRATWNYVDDPSRFIAFLENASRRTTVSNDPRLIRWNMSKRYLAELVDAGLPVIPSLFFDGGGGTLAEARAHFGSNDIILKPVFGGGGFGQIRTTTADNGTLAIQADVFAQPFVPEITAAGEISFIFVGDTFSHCVRKVAAPGQYLIQVIHGGAELPYDPTLEEVHAARRFVLELPYPALAVRVDLVPTPGGMLLMELEAIEPHLFPQLGATFPDLFAEAVAERLA